MQTHSDVRIPIVSTILLVVTLAACGPTDRQPSRADVADYMNTQGYSQLTAGLKVVPAICELKPEDVAGLHCGKDPFMKTAQGHAVLTCAFTVQNANVVIRANDTGKWYMTTESVYPPIPESLCKPDPTRCADPKR